MVRARLWEYLRSQQPALLNWKSIYQQAEWLSGSMRSRVQHSVCTEPNMAVDSCDLGI